MSMPRAAVKTLSGTRAAWPQTRHAAWGSIRFKSSLNVAREAQHFNVLSSAPQVTTSLRVAGVPEHFNAPFHLAHERGLYKDLGIDFAWDCTPQGTGAMAQKLEAGDVDVAVMLSEGAVARVAAGAPIRLVGTYVRSPLRWGVHVKQGSPIQSLEDLKGKTFGISRKLSGSHLMAHVMAHSRGWDLERDAPLKIVNTLQGAREAMAAGEIDAWLWEKFTTKHLVDSGEWDIIGEVPTPWPCFLFVASQKAIQERPEAIRDFVRSTRAVCDEFKANAGGSTISYVSEHHQLRPEDAEEWLSGTEWACSLEVTRETLRSTQEALVVIGQLTETTPDGNLIDSSLCELA
eukprot:TRINITY_DN9363_c0_g1_i2.p1 TRINITY_DN9363_c0_g1~~TRINITY_DN9363_c0_g1_i2.p1  ORF type:complete len:346 (-),score=81.57 TRINITY_DN9363_c0_g1_i2:230-1267(-)